MKPETAKAIQDAADYIGIDLEIHEDYAGRGMYGDTTHGVVTCLSDLLQCVVQATSMMRDDKIKAFQEDLSNVRTDSMGRYNTIFY